MTVLALPPTLMAAGAHVFSGTVSDADTLIAFQLDRTPTGGLNDLTPDSTVALQAEQSTDGGVTWDILTAGGPWPGGTELDKHGVQRTFDQCSSQLGDGTSRLIRATVTVAGPVSVVVAGTVTTS
jgi:hypothetical protein